MIRKIILTTFFFLLIQTYSAMAGTTGSEDLSKKSATSADECFEGFSRAMFAFNHGLDTAVLVGTGTGVLVGSGIAVLVGISAGVLTGLGIAVLVGTGIVVLVTSMIEVVGLLELTESTNWGELVLVSCVHAANNKRYIVVINILLLLIFVYYLLRII